MGSNAMNLPLGTVASKRQNDCGIVGSHSLAWEQVPCHRSVSTEKISGFPHGTPPGGAARVNHVGERPQGRAIGGNEECKAGRKARSGARFRIVNID
jgi:hypothetical protein